MPTFYTAPGPADHRRRAGGRRADAPYRGGVVLHMHRVIDRDLSS